MFNRVAAIARYTALETLRQRVPLVLAFFGILLTLGALLLGQLSVRQDEKLLKDFGLAAIDLFGSIITIFLGTDLIAKEIQKKSLYPLLAKPLQRYELIIGRYLGLLATISWNVAFMGIALAGVIYATFRTFDPRLFIAVGGVILSLTLLSAISVLFSSTSPPVLATILTLATFFIGRQSDILRNMGQATKEVSDVFAKSLYYLLPNFRLLDFKNAVVYGEGVPYDVLITSCSYVGLYSLALLALASFLFEKRDLV